MTMFSKRLETKTARISGETGLGPLLRVRVEASKLLEASADLVVEGFQGVGVVTGGHHPDGVNHFAEAGAATKQLEGHLRIRNFTQRLQNARRFVDAGLRVLVAEVWGPDRSAKQFEITVPNDLEVGGEAVTINCRGRPTSMNQLSLILAYAFFCIVGQPHAKLETNVLASCFEFVERRSDSQGITGEAEVIQVGVDQLKPTWGTRVGQLLQHRL